MNKSTIVVGGGIAGMTAAGELSRLGVEVTLVEQEQITGGHAACWDRLFPTRRPAEEVISFLREQTDSKVNKFSGRSVTEILHHESMFTATLSDGTILHGESLVLATGYDLFDASRKEEYGYGIYDNVITSAELEGWFKNHQLVRTKNGRIPSRVAFIHCVGSRDEKVGNLYCSKVCCITGVKQAIEVKEALPACDVYSFYMDLRMFDRNFEELYFEAQKKYGITFIRGRLSECSENADHTLVVKTEDTLTGKPMKMIVDLVVLLVGFVPRSQNTQMLSKLKLITGNDGFLQPEDEHNGDNLTRIPGLFITGAVKGPVTIANAVADARATALQVYSFLHSNR